MKIKQEKIDDFEVKRQEKQPQPKAFEDDEDEMDMINFVTSDSFDQLLTGKPSDKNEGKGSNEPRAPSKKRKVTSI